jgi:hypothetical protein
MAKLKPFNKYNGCVLRSFLKNKYNGYVILFLKV